MVIKLLLLRYEKGQHQATNKPDLHKLHINQTPRLPNVAVKKAADFGLAAFLFSEARNGNGLHPVERI